MGRQQTLDAADAIAVFDFGAEGMFVPVASGTFQGAGFHDPDEAISRYATPLDFQRFQSIQPPSSWALFHESIGLIITELTEQGGLEELVAWAESIGLVIRGANNHVDVVFGLNLALEHPSEFGSGAAQAYSHYIGNQAQSYLDLVVKTLPAMFNAHVCAAWISMDSRELLILVAEHLASQSNSRLDQTIAAMEQWIAGNPTLPSGSGMPTLDCSGLLEALKGLRTALDLFASARDWLTTRMSDSSKAWEDFGYIALFLAEMLRSRGIARVISDAVGVNEPEAVRAERIGAIYGMLVGMIVWECIEEVFTAGLGKGARVVRFIR